MNWHLYDVAVSGYGSEIITAPSRGKALASAFRSDAFSHLRFADFLKIVTVRLRHDPPDDDGYSYVRRHYGVDPQIGQRVTHVGCSSLAGASGTVLYPGKSTAHVRVLFDGREHPVAVHPSDLACGDTPTPSLAKQEA